MLERIRQVAVITGDVERTARRYGDVFGLRPVSSDELAEFAVKRVLFRLGDTYLELLQPTTPDGAASRFLERRGSGLYGVTFAVHDRDAAVADLRSKGVTVTRTHESPVERLAWLHPRDTHGVLIELAQRLQLDPVPLGGSTPIVTQIRQVVIIVGDIEAALRRYDSLFGLRPSRRDEVARVGFKAAYMPLGRSGTFVELIEPMRPDTPAGRFLDRRGEGMYLVILETPRWDAALDRVRGRGAEVTGTWEWPDFRLAWLHPRSMDGAFFQLSQATGENPWPPAGPDWWR